VLHVIPVSTAGLFAQLMVAGVLRLGSSDKFSFAPGDLITFKYKNSGVSVTRKLKRVTWRPNPTFAVVLVFEEEL
jgi:hypothetical protein